MLSSVTYKWGTQVPHSLLMKKPHHKLYLKSLTCGLTGILSLLLVAENSSAQQSIRTAFEACTQISDERERLRCFDGLADSEAEVMTAESPVATETTVEQPNPIEPAQAIDALDDLGLEHLEEYQREAIEQIAELEVEATVARVTANPHGLLYFHLDNGQVWRQLERARLNYPKNEPFMIVISQGFMGDYRLRINGTGRMIRIRRTR